MSWRNIKTIAKVNLIYAIPSMQLNNYRKKQQKKDVSKHLSRTIFLQQGLLGLIYFLYFGIVVGYLVPLGQSPGFFASMVGTFSLLVIAQSFTSFYNVFYDSRDLAAYRPYAFKESEVILGKSSSIILAAIAGISPIMSYFVITAIQFGQIWYTLPLAIFYLFFYLMILALLVLVLVHFICQSKLFKKHKNLISNLLLGFSILLTVGVYLLMNRSGRGFIRDGNLSIFPIFESFYYMIVHPLSMQAVYGLAAWLLLAVLLVFLVFTKVLPNFYDATLAVSAISDNRKRERQTQTNMGKSLRTYWLNQIKEGTVLLQGVLMPNLIPIIFIVSFLSGASARNFSFDFVTSQQFLYLFVLLAVAFAFFSASNTLTSFAFSMEKEGFDYIKTLPLSQKAYAKSKFLFFFLVQSILPGLLLLGVSLYIKLGLVNILAVFTTWLATSLALSAYAYKYDYTHRMSNWNNITDLANRGKKVLRTLLVLGLLLVFFILIASGASFIAMSARIIGVIIGLVAWVLVIGADLIIATIILKDFWASLDQ